MDTRDTSAIGAALGRVVERHGQIRLKDQKPIIPSYFQPEAVRTFAAELAREGFEIVRRSC